MTRSRAFRRTRDGHVRVSLEAHERGLLDNLRAQMSEVVGETEGPIADRLYPAAYRDDPDASAEFAMLVTGELRSQRAAHLERVRETIHAELLTEDDALAWLGFLNDVRLALGVALGIESDGWQETRSPDPQVAILEYLGYLQGTLLEAL